MWPSRATQRDAIECARGTRVYSICNCLDLHAMPSPRHKCDVSVESGRRFELITTVVLPFFFRRPDRLKPTSKGLFVIYPRNC
jgi:hypothetical protein